MASEVQVRITGADELRRMLQQVEERVRRRLMAAALRAAASKVFAPAARRAAPAQSPAPKKRGTTKGTGLVKGPLRRAISIRRIRRPGPGRVKLQVITKTKRIDAWYARFLETGWTTRGKRTPVPGKPWMGPAANAGMAEAVETIRLELGRRIEAEFAKRGAR